MMHQLFHQVASKLKEHNLSIGAAEKKAKIAVGTIDKIVSNVSTNPRLNTLVSLKKLFQCSLDDLTLDQLLITKTSITPFMTQGAFEHPLDIPFFINILNALQQAQKTLNKKLPPKVFLETAIEAYGLLWKRDVPVNEFVTVLLQKNLSF